MCFSRHCEIKAGSNGKPLLLGSLGFGWYLNDFEMPRRMLQPFLGRWSYLHISLVELRRWPRDVLAILTCHPSKKGIQAGFDWTKVAPLSALVKLHVKRQLLLLFSFPSGCADYWVKAVVSCLARGCLLPSIVRDWCLSSFSGRLACQAMRQLHPEAIAVIQSKVLFSKAEEQLLSKVGSVRAVEWCLEAPSWFASN